jgi:hypothetical protein
VAPVSSNSHILANVACFEVSLVPKNHPATTPTPTKYSLCRH